MVRKRVIRLVMQRKVDVRAYSKLLDQTKNGPSCLKKSIFVHALNSGAVLSSPSNPDVDDLV
jgi:hypothetical protein